MTMFNTTQSHSSNFPVFGFKSDYSYAPISSNKSLNSSDFEILSAKEFNEESAQTDIIFESREFDINFGFEFLDIIHNYEANQLVFILGIENLAVIELDVIGEWQGGNSKNFVPNGLNLKLVKKFPNPASAFFVSTLWSTIGLSQKLYIKIPEIRFDVSATLELPVKEISTLLQERQVAQRVLIIETALDTELPFPDGFIPGTEVENIAFCYHAIFDREFYWSATPKTMIWYSNTESLPWLPSSDKPSPLTFKPELVTKTIFGRELKLGLMTGTIDDAIIDNYDEVKEKLSKLNNEPIYIQLRSVSGKSKIISFDVPSFDIELWVESFRNLYDLEKLLDEKLVEKYYEVATSTLNFLNQEKKNAIIERPQINPQIEEN